MKIRLTEIEREFLVKNVLKNNASLIKIIERVTMDKGKYLLDIDSVVADEIRDLCSEQLQINGFDEDYNLNNVGEILEYLIDIFYID